MKSSELLSKSYTHLLSLAKSTLSIPAACQGSVPMLGDQRYFTPCFPCPFALLSTVLAKKSLRDSHLISSPSSCIVLRQRKQKSLSTFISTLYISKVSDPSSPASNRIPSKSIMNLTHSLGCAALGPLILHGRLQKTEITSQSGTGSHLADTFHSRIDHRTSQRGHYPSSRSSVTFATASRFGLEAIIELRASSPAPLHLQAS